MLNIKYKECGSVHDTFRKLSLSFRDGKSGLCLLPNTCAGFGIRVLSELELRHEGLRFANFGSAVSADDALSMRRICFMLLVEVIIYMILAWSAIERNFLNMHIFMSFPCPLYVVCWSTSMMLKRLVVFIAFIVLLSYF